jgi:DNA polymerase
MKIGIDFETYSDCDLKTKGLWNYVADPTFQPLMVATVYDSAFGRVKQLFDFILDPDALALFEYEMGLWLEDRTTTFIAHNAGFERAVLTWMGFDINDRVRDSAVYARMLGVGEKLEVASRQLTSTHKLAVGGNLIQLFCVPNSWNKGSVPTAERILADHPEDWVQFGTYCEVDAEAGLDIELEACKLFESFGAGDLMAREDELELITHDMNSEGWHIDRPLIERMALRAWANTLIEEKQFFLDTDAQLNFRSPVQLKKYCADRNVKVTSLDKYQLPGVLARVEAEILEGKADEKRAKELDEVRAMLLCKTELGGSSLSKLNTILNLAGEDDQLRNQYIHVGAGQTFRTSGRGVQMQNLKKLAGNIRDMDTMYDYKCEWTNTDMANQLRQVFTSRSPAGKILVGDFSAVESRGLAYLAGEEWKLEAYRQGLDVYKVLVTRFEGFEHLTVDDVTAELRPRGKYSELSCGYQASAVAVQDFMFRLGFKISLDEAAQNVSDWRRANPAIIQFWRDLDYMLKTAVQTNHETGFETAYGQWVRVIPFTLPSIQEIHPGALSLCLQILDKGKDGKPIVTRFVHGAYFHGKSLAYYKPVDHLTDGKLWEPINKEATRKARIKDKRTKDILYTIYGGKLAGIFTQSLCREMFYDSMLELYRSMQHVAIPNARMIGQFHDEIGVDWWPEEDGMDEDMMLQLMDECMSNSKLPGFPLTADIKSAFRYIK